MLKKKSRAKSRESAANGSSGGKKPHSNLKKKVKKQSRNGKSRKNKGENTRKRKSYTEQEWFWGLFTQEEAEQFLKSAKNGEFLVRNVLYQDTTAIIISVAATADRESKVHHLRAAPRGARWQLENLPARHRTLVDLVNYYQTHQIGMTGVRLKFVAEQPDWLIRNRQILSPKSAKRLGGGQFSDVVIGAYQRRLVAIKRLTSTGDRLMLDRGALMKEAMIMHKLQHPYITRMVGISVDRLPPMLLVEIMAGSLDGHLEKHGAVTESSEKVLYCLQIAKALAHMASQGIVHRDMACRNVLISRFGILKVSDFGLSEYEANCTSTNLKKDKFPVAWMPPESVNLKNTVMFNEKTDVWGFGVTCNEIFENARRPLRQHDEPVRAIMKWKGKGVLHRLTKAMPVEMKELVNKCLLFKNEDRPKFEEIVTVLDLMIKLSHFPPALHLRSVNLIDKCRPLTNCEYELMHRNNWDWQPKVRKARREVKVKAKTENLEPKKWKNPKKALVKLRRKLRMRRKKLKMREKMRAWRLKRRHERKRQRVLREIQMEQAKTKVRARGRKRIRKKCVKLVHIYWKLMAVKWRKRAPNRKTRLRLRRHRVINKKSKHPASRNGKAVRIMKTRIIRWKKNKFVKPVIQKRRKLPKKPMKPKQAKTPQMTSSRMGKSMGKKKEGADGAKLSGEAWQEKRKRAKKQEVLRLRKRNMRKRRKRHRRKRRQRRRQKRRRRYRRKKRQAQIKALTIEQKDRMRQLKRRRRHRRRLLYRVKRRQKIGKILRDWRFVRKLMMKRRQRKDLKRKQNVSKPTKASNRTKKHKKSKSAERRRGNKKELAGVHFK